jgi:hypothetical protein
MVFDCRRDRRFTGTSANFVSSTIKPVGRMYVNREVTNGSGKAPDQFRNCSTSRPCVSLSSSRFSFFLCVLIFSPNQSFWYCFRRQNQGDFAECRPSWKKGEIREIGAATVVERSKPVTYVPGYPSNAPFYMRRAIIQPLATRQCHVTLH